MHLLEGRFHFDSRNRSVEDYHYKNRSVVLNHMLNVGKPPADLEGTVLDGEFVYKDGLSGNLNKAVSISNTDPNNIQAIMWAYQKVGYIAFDVIRHQGKDVTYLPFKDRRQILDEVVKRLNLSGYPYISQSRLFDKNKAYWMDERIRAGFEGVMFKDINAAYHEDKRVRDQYKLKRTLRFDAIVTGFKPAKADRAFAGLVGAIEFSINIQGRGIIPIAYCQPGTVAFRKEISTPDGEMIQEMYGRQAEIIGMNFTVNGFLSHARIVKWNDGGYDEACVHSPTDKRFKKSIHFKKG
jgi:ATP-dependent DNA ligase